MQQLRVAVAAPLDRTLSRLSRRDPRLSQALKVDLAGDPAGEGRHRQTATLSRTPPGYGAGLFLALLTCQIASSWLLPPCLVGLAGTRRGILPESRCGILGRRTRRQILHHPAPAEAAMTAASPATATRRLAGGDREGMIAFLQEEVGRGSGAGMAMLYRACDYGDAWAEREAWYADAASWGNATAVLSLNLTGSYAALTGRDAGRVGELLAAVSAEGAICWKSTMFAALDEVLRDS